MKAQENSFLNLLTGKHQFVVPVYQRPYSWTLGPCIKLWEDVTRIASLQTQNTHFMGSILYSQIDPINEFGTVPQYEIVDGQQRTVTLSLLLAAIANTLNSFPLQTDFTTESIYSDYLINRYANGMQKYKMLLSSHDQDTFINLIEQPEQASSLNKKGNHLVENYVFFVDQIRTSNIDPTSLYKSLQKLIVIEISLSEEHDDLLRIFESINVTGLSLTQADLIRNDVFKGLNTKEQEQLYDSYWYPLEDTLSLKEKPDLFYKFMQDYLKQQLGQAPEIEDLYASFRAYHSSRLELPIKEIVEDMLDKSVSFAKQAGFYTKHAQIREPLKDVENLQIRSAQIFVTEVYRDHVRKLITLEDLITILRLVECYIFRNLICGVFPKKIEKIIWGLADEMNKNDYLNSFRNVLFTQSSSELWLNDEIFRKSFVSKDLYHLPTHLRNYLFRKLECFGRKEHVVIEKYSVEHIMPQNPQLSSEWQQEFGVEWKDIQNRYLHTIGNLTLTGYNSELSDRPFLEKRDMKGGFADSPLRLNRNLARLQKWNREEIEKRADELADLALKIWAISN